MLDIERQEYDRGTRTGALLQGRSQQEREKESKDNVSGYTLKLQEGGYEVGKGQRNRNVGWVNF